MSAREDLDHRPVLDLSMAQFEHRRGDLVVFGTWIGAESADSEPCLAIVPVHRTRGFQPAVVGLSAAWRWHFDARHAAATAMAFCHGLGLDAVPSNARRLTDLILDHLDALVAMPPRPHRHEIVGGHAFIREDDGPVQYAEIVHRI